MTSEAAPAPDIFTTLAVKHDLLDRGATSPDRLLERYPYSQDMSYRYAFGRWWDSPDPEPPAPSAQADTARANLLA